MRAAGRATHPDCMQRGYVLRVHSHADVIRGPEGTLPLRQTNPRVVHGGDKEEVQGAIDR